MGLVKEEDELGPVKISHLGQGLKELGHHPQQEHGVDLGAGDELGGIEDVDVAVAVFVAGKPILQVKIGLSEEYGAALVLKGDQGPKDSAYRLGRDPSVGGLILLGVLGHVVEHGAQILDVNK